MPSSRANFQMLGQTADCAWRMGCDDALGSWTQAFRDSCEAGLEWADWDRHGRFIGRARVRREGADAVLLDAWLPRGGLRPWAGMVATRLRRLGVERLDVPGRKLRRPLTLDRLAGLAAPEPDRTQPLHPVLAGMADADAQETVTLGQALALLAAEPRYAALPVVEAVDRIKRASGSGQLRLWTQADGEPRGLLIWARPSKALLAALRQRSAQRFHAAEWNEGGEPAVLELCATDTSTAGEVAAAAIALPEVDEAGLHVRLDDARGRATLVSVHGAELAAFSDWLAQALRPACC